MDEYPGNSRQTPKKMPEKSEAPKQEQITTGKVIVKKPGLGKRFASAFTGDDGRSVMSHVVLATQEEGNEVLKRMLELIRTYKQVSVGDLFDLVDIRSTFREESWGWKSLEGAGVKRVKDGWELKFPEPEHLG